MPKLTVRFVLMLLPFLLWANASVAATAPGSEVLEARRAGWDTANVITQGMVAADPRRFPGIHAWLKEFRAAGGTPGKRSPGAGAPGIDAARLVSRNPAFWQAYFEMAPGDPGAMLLHAALLLAGGEASRSAYVLVMARQTPQIGKPMLDAINALLGRSQQMLDWGTQRAAQAAKLHDDGSVPAAVDQLRALIRAWPENAAAHYELALALVARQYLDAGRKPPTRARLRLHLESKPAAEARSAFASARGHDPLLIRAYQGDETPSGDVLLVLGTRVRPLWDIVARGAQGARDNDLRDLAAALRDAGLWELALCATQVLIGREGGYDDEDRRLVEASLRILAPAAADTVTKRLAQPEAEFARFVFALP